MDVWEGEGEGGGGGGGGKGRTLKNRKMFFQGGENIKTSQNVFPRWKKNNKKSQMELVQVFKIFRSVIKYFLFPPVCVGFR